MDLPEQPFSIFKIGWRCALMVLAISGFFSAYASSPASRVILKPNFNKDERELLETQLAKITGWSGIKFDERDRLTLPDEKPSGGSATARDMLKRAVSGPNLILIEAANKRADVVFCKVVPGKWNNSSNDNPNAFVVLIDFSDFEKVVGDRTARASFNPAWGMLHEFVHVVEDSVDPEENGEPGDCEASVNRMRRELGVPERENYFFTSVPGQENSLFSNRLVRLAFDDAPSDRKSKRHWLVWDANEVGGLPRESSRIAVR